MQSLVAEKFFRGSFSVRAFPPLCWSESARTEKARWSRDTTLGWQGRGRELGRWMNYWGQDSKGPKRKDWRRPGGPGALPGVWPGSVKCPEGSRIRKLGSRTLRNKGWSLSSVRSSCSTRSWFSPGSFLQAPGAGLREATLGSRHPGMRPE